MPSNWSRQQLRYREILREIRSHLCGVGKYGIIRILRRTSPEFFEREAIRKTREDACAIAAASQKLAELVEQATLAAEMRLRLEPEKERLLSALQAVRGICEDAKENQPSDDQVRRWCAKVAFTLMVRFSDKPPTSGSANSPYRVITGLLYEIVTGEAGRDFKRACDDELKDMRPLLTNS